MSDYLEGRVEELEEELRAARDERDDAVMEAAAEKAAGQRVQLSHYAGGRYGEQQTLLSPEASQSLLTRVLAEAGAKVVIGALIVEWDSDERPDIIVFADGNVREINPSEQPERARRIVEAARGRERGPGKLSRNEDHRPSLPEGTQTLPTVAGPWQPYLVAGTVDEGTWMAHDVERDRFDARFEWASNWQALARCYWLNARTDDDGNVNAQTEAEAAADADALLRGEPFKRD